MQQLVELARRLDAGAVLYGARTMDDHLQTVVAQPRLNSTVASIYAVLAVVLATSGVYGVMAYSVAQRRAEIGIRLTLGAQRFAILRLIISEGASIIAASILAGGVFTALVVMWLRSTGITSSAVNVAPIVGWAGVCLGAAALIACWVPARRAMLVDPLAVMRRE
jgi:ABC-type antimicrobial peptide transport system permease subunit